ncbi:UNVERIFIED_CONTAM: hypothetical protein GTU68_016300 [Idotea baltica]|nr:hypothetical protein [Idotea baltica]
MLQTLPKVREEVSLAVLGKHHLPEDVPVITLRELIRLGNDPAPRVFHARRNNEMLQALLARKLGARLKIVFTSTAQRHHTRFTKWLMSQMDGILTTCSAAASYLDQQPDVMIPHGIDLNRYQAPANKTEAWQKLGFPGKYGIGIFGRVRPQKGVDVLIEAALPLLKNNPDPTLVIVGETTPKFRDYQRELEGKVTAAGLSDRVVFHGSRPSGELPIPPSLDQGMSSCWARASLPAATEGCRTSPVLGAIGPQTAAVRGFPCPETWLRE